MKLNTVLNSRQHQAGALRVLSTRRHAAGGRLQPCSCLSSRQTGRRSLGGLLALSPRLDPTPATPTTFSSSTSTRTSRVAQLLIASAAARNSSSSGGASADDDSPESLKKLKLPELKERCKALGLNITGNKSTLIQRILDHLQPPSASSSSSAAGGAGGDLRSEEEDVEQEELLRELVAEVGQYPPETLAACLADRGLSTAGTRQQQVERLAEAISGEIDLNDPAAAAAVAAQQQQQQDETTPAAAAPAPAAAAAAAPATPTAPTATTAASSEREWLIADKQQVLYDELLAMGVMRQELVDILADMGQTAAEGESLDELAERASWLLAEEEVLLMEQQQQQQAAGTAGAPDASSAAAAGGDSGATTDAAAAGGGVSSSEALADHPSSMLDGLTATDINKMKVDDLRRYLSALGLSDEGSRYVLRDRLVTMLVVRKAATAGDMDYLLRQLSSMTLSELRGELERRGLDLSGTKASLELRLAQAMVVEIAGPDAASGLGLGQDGGAGAEGQDGGKASREFEAAAPLSEPYDEFLTAVMDPAFRVALLCGTTPYSLQQQQQERHSGDTSSSSSSLQRVSDALATAVTIVDELHTAPLDPQQAAKWEQAVAAAAAGGGGEGSGTAAASSSSSSSKSKRKSKRSSSSTSADADADADTAAATAATAADPSKVPLCGITVDVYWGDAGGTFYQLPRTALAATAPADLASPAVLPALATAKFDSLAALAVHLKSTGAGAVLSLLPGGALACGGQLAAACEAEGVPLAVHGGLVGGGDAGAATAAAGDVGAGRGKSSSRGTRSKTASKEQQQSSGAAAAQPVLGRAAVLQELRQRGYMTLPVFEVARDQVLAARDELKTWLDSLLPPEEEEGEVDPDDAFATAAAADGGDDSSSSTAAATQERKAPSSRLLKAWTGARYGDAAAAAAAAAGNESSSSSSSSEPAAAAAEVAMPALADALGRWCVSEGLDPNGQLFGLSGAAGGELVAAVRGGARLLQRLVDMVTQDGCPSSLLIEPLHRQLCRWEVVVTVSPEGGAPVALLPVEVEGVNIKQDLLDAELALQEWRMMQAGLDADTITAQLEALSAADEPECIDTLRVGDSPDPLPYHQLKMHTPPRASTKLIHTMRHAAAKAVSDLSLKGAGLVRVRGWFAASPGWQERHTPQPQDIVQMPDEDPRQLQRMRDAELSRRSAEPLPLSDYYDEVLLLPDLAAFNPAQRCRAESNGEGDVLLSDVSVDVPLHATSLAGIQAAELGLGAGGLARHLINTALFAAGRDPLLPPAPPPALDASAQWAQVTGANDTLGEIAGQLAAENERLREMLETGHHKVADDERRAAVASLGVDTATLAVIDGLSFVGGTMEALDAPLQQPEEWTPEFDPRSLEEIHAERDAQRMPEDLAARQMRDENLPVYGDQPIHYDRYDDMLDWEPPFAAAAAAGQPVPSIEQLRAEVADRIAKREAELAEGEQSVLPGVTEDEVVYARLLEGSFYDGGVKEAISRRAQQAQETAGGGGAATLAAAALTANVDAAAAAAEKAAFEADNAAAVNSSSSGSSGSSSSSRSSRRRTSVDSISSGGGGGGSDAGSLIAAANRWPWPTTEEVLDEAAERRAAQRVWVLMGGDGPARQQSLRSGANIVAKLQRCCDLQVDAFLLPPCGAGLDEGRRRAALLSRRTEWLALGIPADEYPSSMGDDELLSMPPMELESPLQRPVIVLGPNHLARHSVEEAAESAERQGLRASTTYAGARVQEAQQIQAVRDTQLELDSHFVAGVGASFGASAPGVLPPAPRFLDLQEFVCEAAACGATVLLAAHDTLTATGQLQQLLEGAGVGYTGLTSDFAVQCCNRIALNKAVTEYADALAEAATAAAAAAGDSSAAAGGNADDDDDEAVGLIPLPLKVLKTDKLISCLQEPEAFESLFADIQSDWEASPAFSLRPPADSGGLGVARITCPQDLAAYAAALAAALPRLPPGMLSLSSSSSSGSSSESDGSSLQVLQQQQQHKGVTLPLEPPALLVVEPWVQTALVNVSASPAAAGGGSGGSGSRLEVTWATTEQQQDSSSNSSSSSDRWLEVSIGLMGELGSMQALPLTLIAQSADGSRHLITPPPANILPAHCVEAAQGVAVALSVGLGLRSIASVDGFVNADSGELIVRDVKATPALTGGSPLLQQVQHLDPPLLPHQLFRQLARDAWATNQAARAAAAAGLGGGSSLSSALYSSTSGDAAGGLSAADFDLGAVGGDIFDQAAGGVGGDEGGDEEAGDEDVQGLAGYTM